jgi:hypothetical protein
MSFTLYRNIPALLGLTLAWSLAAQADDIAAPAPATVEAPASASGAPAATHAGDWDQVIQLGKIKVEADPQESTRRIVAGLKVIKAALKTNLSDDPADADKVVCRMNYDTGSHLNAHLMCATNRSMRQYKEQLHAAQMVHTNGIPDGGEEQLLENMNGEVARSRYFSTKIRASELQKMLLQVQCDGCSDGGLVLGNN